MLTVSEMAGVVMLLEIPIVLGFCVPILIPLACLSFWLHAAAFEHSKLPFEENCKPSTHFLGVSLAIGMALLGWIFYESNLHGTWMVLFGTPVTAMCTVYVPWLYEKFRARSLGNSGAIMALQAPLMTNEQMQDKEDEDE